MTGPSTVLLVAHGATDATRRSRFPLDEPLEAGAVDAARERAAGPGGVWGPWGVPGRRTIEDGATLVTVSPSLRCHQTAEALGLVAAGRPGAGPVPPDPAPDDWRLGRWAGLTLDAVAGAEPDAVQQWISDPAAHPHGGEPLTGLVRRVGGWLDAVPPGRVVVVTHPAVVRAALVHALAAPAEVFWRIDAGPLATVRLRGRAGRWSLRP